MKGKFKSKGRSRNKGRSYSTQKASKSIKSQDLREAEYALRNWTRHGTSVGSTFNPALAGMGALSSLGSREAITSRNRASTSSRLPAIITLREERAKRDYAFMKALSPLDSVSIHNHLVSAWSEFPRAIRSNSLSPVNKLLSPKSLSDSTGLSAGRIVNAVSAPLSVMKRLPSQFQSLWHEAASHYHQNTPMAPTIPRSRRFATLPHQSDSLSHTGSPQNDRMPGAQRRGGRANTDYGSSLYDSDDSVPISSTASMTNSFRSTPSMSSSLRSSGSSPFKVSPSSRKLSTLGNFLPKASAGLSAPPMATTVSPAISPLDAGIFTNFTVVRPGASPTSPAAFKQDTRSPITVPSRDITLVGYLRRNMLNKFKHKKIGFIIRTNRERPTTYTYKPEIQLQNERALMRLRPKTALGAMHQMPPGDYRNDFPSS